MQYLGHCGKTRDYGLPAWLVKTEAAKRIAEHNAARNSDGVPTYFLPMAFSAGSPMHPAYGAGHATVAGASVTVLKAWYDENQRFCELVGARPRRDPFEIQPLLQPGPRLGHDAFGPPTQYTEDDAAQMTVGGELNKLAGNVAMGRSMGGVHWRTDNTRSLRLGEQIAIEILRKRTAEYAERPVSFTFRAFDRHMVQISQGEVRKF